MWQRNFEVVLFFVLCRIIISMSFKCQRDSYLRHFTSAVLSCEPSRLGETGGYEVVLRDTILFPEGGGQVRRRLLWNSRGLKYCCSILTNCKVRNYLWSYASETLTNTILQYHQPHPSIKEWAPSTHRPAWHPNWLWNWNYSFDRNPPVSHIHILCT